MKINYKYIVSIVLCVFATIQSTVVHAGIFDDLKNAIADGLDTGKQNYKIYKTVEDKSLVDAFYFISQDGAEQGVQKDILAIRKYKFVKLTSASLTFSDFFMKQPLFSIVRDMESYSFSPLDIFGKKYVAFANARGNLVKQYKPSLGGVLNSMLEQNHMFRAAPNVRTWLDVDNVLAEYAPNGELISLMTRSHQASEQLIGTSNQYIHFYFGKELMRIVENKVSNQTLENSFQRVVVLGDKLPDLSVSELENGSLTQSAMQSESISKQATVTPAVMQSASAVAPKQMMRIQLLQQLADLKKSGALTDDEFTKEKNKILSD